MTNNFNIQTDQLGMPFVELVIEPKFLPNIYNDKCSEKYLQPQILVFKEDKLTFFNYYPIGDCAFKAEINAERFVREFRRMVDKHIVKSQEDYDLHCNNLLLFSHIIDAKFIELMKSNSNHIVHTGLLKAYYSLKEIIRDGSINIEVYVGKTTAPYKLTCLKNKKFPIIFYQDKNLTKNLSNPNKAHPEQNLAIGLTLRLMFSYLANNDVKFKSKDKNLKKVHAQFLYDYLDYFKIYQSSPRNKDGILQVSENWKKVIGLMQRAMKI
ncbi:hypothetical protein [Mucilaginibacter sp.]